MSANAIIITSKFIVGRGLSSTLTHAEQQHRLQGFKVNSGDPSINHLFFANESIFFCKASIIDNLAIYEKDSGQMINFSKSSLFFNANTDPQCVSMGKEMLDNQCIGSINKYLGLPALIGRAKQETFDLIIERKTKPLWLG